MFDQVAEMAQRFFELQLPFTEEELKRAFRKACFKLHPDSGGDADKFKQMIASYEILVSHAQVEGGTVVENIDGIPMSQWGKGLNINKACTDCPSCQGRGWTSYGGNGGRKYRCWTCKGAGEIINPNPVLPKGVFEFTSRQ